MKAIFLDVDGTLTIPGETLPPDSALKAVRLAQAAGNRVFLCTGRNLRMNLDLLPLGFDGMVASSGGYCTLGGEVIVDSPIPEDLLAHAREVMNAHGAFFTMECRDGAFTDDKFKAFLLKCAGGDENSEILRMRRQIARDFGFYDFSAWKGEPAYKLSVMAETREQLVAAGEELKEHFHLVIQQTYDGGSYYNGELLSRGFSKGTGVRAVCARLGIPLADTYGFGDSMNDLEMMEIVGFSVCMENGSPALKEKADAVCPPVTEEGLYRAFETYGLF